jgi:ATP-dependent DNA ligase
MELPLPWPLPPMLGKLARELPREGVLYEPKWDGFRCLALRDGDEVDLRSRHGNPLARYFPELVEGMLALPGRRFVIDGEIVPRNGDFPALMARLHPADSRVERLRRETPAAFVVFDVLAEGDAALLDLPFVQRRERLEVLLADARPPVFLTPATDDVAEAAAWLERFEGVIAKRRDLEYEPGRRVMVKVKRDRTADCVVAGLRWRVDRPLPSSLLLGLYDAAGALQHVGVASSFGVRRAEALLDDLRPLVVPLEGHPWEHGFLVGGGPIGRLRGAAGRWTPEMTMDWTPVAPTRVAEVAYDQVDSDRFRHPARFRRWRLDRDPRSCTFEQLELGTPELEDVLARR